MDFGSLLTGSILDIVVAIAAFVVVLSVIVFVHEYGHFKIARLCGVNVETFSIGFGRSIGGFYDRYGTYWKIGWLPLGGYVKFAGDAGAASLPSKEALKNATPGDFHSATLWKRALIVVAGPMANFILSILVYSLMFMIMGIPVTQPKISAVVENSAAAEAGFQPDDLITAIDGRQISSFQDLQRIVSVSGNTELVFTVNRSGSIIELNARPKVIELKDSAGNVVKIGQLGVSRGNDEVIKVERLGPVAAFSRAVDETWFIITRSLGCYKGDDCGHNIS